MSIYVNLQWLAILPAMVGLIFALRTVASVISLFFDKHVRSDGLASAMVFGFTVKYFVMASAYLAFTWLTWMAFR